MDRHKLRYFDSLGQGGFGWIVRGKYRKDSGDNSHFDEAKTQTVMVCMLKEEASQKEKQKFLDEIQFAAQFSYHLETTKGIADDDLQNNTTYSNVVKLVGVCVESPPFLAIYEECKLGDLKTFLVNSRGTMYGR